MTTGLLWHELYMWHDTGTAAWVMPPGLTVEPFKHVENADGKRRIRNLVEVSGLLDHLVQLKPRPATEDEFQQLKEASDRHGSRCLSAFARKMVLSTVSTDGENVADRLVALDRRLTTLEDSLSRLFHALSTTSSVNIKA